MPPVLALGVIVWRVARGPREGREAWLVYAVFLVIAVAVMLVQIRASRMVTSLAVPAGAWLIVAARHYCLARRTPPRVGLLLLSWIGSAGIAVAVIVIGIRTVPPGGEAPAAGQQALADRRQCVMPEASRRWRRCRPSA